MRPSRRTLVSALWIAVVAFNLRPAITGVGPVLPDVETGLGLSGVEAALLTTLPLACFGLLGPAGPGLARRLGLELTLGAALGVITVGILLRSGPNVATLYIGTALAGCAIAVCNVLLPAVVKRDFPRHPGLATGAYTTVLGGTAALSAAVAVPLGHAVGRGWRGALGIWLVPAAIAFVVWLPRLRGHTRPPRTEAAAGVRALLRDPLAWALSFYMGIQSLLFYATAAWLPTLYQARGYSETDAGLILAVLTVVGLPTGIIVPTLAARRRDQRAWAAGGAVWTAIGLAGITFAPTAAPYVWAVILGTGVGATFPLALTLVVLRSRTAHDTARLSAFSQSVGYLIAALGPVVVGALHDVTGSWRTAFLLLLALTVPELLFGFASGRSGYVASTPQRARAG